ncbi:DMT family transporter [uncultured Neisseria sp.]|uniref:DMT family transporter n=1 Tax=uncultured Neisseria sp. TaxID=237778 RepID=UPI0025E86B13|nr:DMT family transporter [uncultured Neisseria sp.]
MKHLAIHLKLLGMAAFWGASWPMGRMLGQALPPLTGGMLRFLTAAILLLGWLFARYRLRTLAVLSRKQWLGLALAAAFGVFGFTVLSMLGLQRIPASRATVLVTFNPVLTMFFAALLFGEKLNGKIVSGMLLAVAGSIWAVTHGEIAAFLSGGGVGWGEVLVFFSLCCLVTYTMIGRAVLQGIDALTVTVATAWLGAMMLLPPALISDGLPFGMLAEMDGRGWFALIGLSVGATVLSYAWYFEGVKTLGAGSAAAYITLVPVFGILCSAWFLGEALHISLVAGCLAAVGGLALMQYGRRAV